MQPSFKPPKNEEELQKRASEMTIDAAESLKKTMEQRKAKAVAPFDQEIAFYDAVIKIKKSSL